jgi:hypothetical protein
MNAAATNLPMCCPAEKTNHVICTTSALIGSLHNTPVLCKRPLPLQSAVNAVLRNLVKHQDLAGEVENAITLAIIQQPLCA